MALIDPASAIIAKAKSRYGKRLTAKDYAALIKSDSVADVVRYLKTYTYYSRFLNGVAADIHRGNLENILRKELFMGFLALCKYNRSDSPVNGYILRAAEIKELNKYLTLLAIGRPSEYIFSLETYFDEQTEIPLAKLASLNSYAELLDVLKEHGYRRVLEKYIPTDDEHIDISAIDDAMQVYSLSILYDEIGKIKNKSAKADLISLFDTMCDYDNYSRILRLKQYYDLSGDAIKTHLLPYGSLTGKRLDEILSASTLEEMQESLNNTKIGKKASAVNTSLDITIKGKYDRCRHEMYFSSNPDIVLLAYYILSETELKNIVTIVEGVRYSMEPKNIAEMLIK